VAPWSSDKLIFSRKWNGGFSGGVESDSSLYQIAWPCDYR
jgi:hypothetical protein